MYQIKIYSTQTVWKKLVNNNKY